MVNIVSPFSLRVHLFFQTFLLPFCRGEKVVQDISNSVWALMKWLDGSRKQWKKWHIFTRKIGSHWQYLTKKMSLDHWKIICKYWILFSFSRSIFWYITRKISLIFCHRKNLNFIGMIFHDIFQITLSVLNSKIRLIFDRRGQMR